ncbi:hypothetical protein [Bacillus infantis]|uniref:Uncharacterized protein n=1 Tax=Bacillus infantis TaxID=324767 RepID=A0A5D4QXA8_9BACI|nr:hypothetical protein [Bacillus infantis]TYS41922.1 hypothetical protein FZD51_23690 [Bacillus infantis]
MKGAGQVVFRFLCGSTDTPYLPKTGVNDLAWYFFKDIIKETCQDEEGLLSQVMEKMQDHNRWADWNPLNREKPIQRVLEERTSNL